MIALACTLGTSTGCDSLANLFNLFDPGNGQTDTDVPIISTVAGTGLAGQNGDGLAAADTALYLPQDITMGPDGNLYIVDWNNHRIRRIKDGVVETVAGTGELGPADDGTAIDQQFNHPTNVCFDHERRMVIAAWHNSKVKRCNLETGLVENLAGTGARSFGGDDGPGNAAILDLPSSVDVDAVGNIIISDQANYRIRLLEPNGTIHTIVGDGTAGYAGDGDRAEKAKLNSPKGQSAPPAGRIELDANDRIIIADTGNHVIRLVDNDGTIRTIAGTGTPGYSGDEGPATAAQLNTPSDVAVAPDGSIYVADTQNNCIRVIHPDGEIHTFAGTGEAGYDGDGGDAKLAKLDRPYGVHVAPNGDIYVADTHNHRVRKVVRGQPTDDQPDVMQDDVEIIPCTDAPGSICTFAGTGQLGYNGDDLDRLQTALYWPFDIEFTPSGRTYLIDWNNHKVRELRADGTIHTVIGTDFVGDGPADLADLTISGTSGLRVDLNHPTDMFELPNGLLGVIAWHNHKIRMYDPATGLVFVAMGRNAAFAGDGGAAKDARVNQPARSAIDANGNLLLIDQRNQRIRLFEDYVNKIGDATIRSILGTGTAGATGDGLKPLETQVKWPTGGNPEPTGGIAIDSNGVVYFADTNNHRIRKAVFNADYTDGVVTTICGTGTAGDSGDNGPGTAAQINYPQDIEIGPDGKLYFCDTNNNRVRRIDLTTGMVEAVAGTGEKGYSGDGGAAGTATLNRPFGIAFDKDGYLYICDTFNGRIRKVRL